MPHLGNTNDSKWFRDQSRFGGGTWLLSFVCGQMALLIPVLPTFLPVSRDQNSIFSKILQPASLTPRSKENFCPSCKRETRRQLNAVSASPLLPEDKGHSFKGTPQRNISEPRPGVSTSPPRTQWLLHICARWGNLRDRTAHTTNRWQPGRTTEPMIMKKKNQFDFIGIFAKGQLKFKYSKAQNFQPGI